MCTENSLKILGIPDFLVCCLIAKKFLFVFKINMRIQNYNSNQPAFQAKFLESASLRLIKQYAAEKGKLEKLTAAGKNMDSAYQDTYLRVDLYTKDNKPCVSFSRFVPKDNVQQIKSGKDLVLTNIKEYRSKKACNPLKFALHKLIRLGYDVPNYRLFNEVVVKPSGKINPIHN